jgi:hypothetical protein
MITRRAQNEQYLRIGRTPGRATPHAAGGAEVGDGNARAARLDKILRLPCVVGTGEEWQPGERRSAWGEASAVLLGAGAMATGCGVVGTRWRCTAWEGREDRGRFLLRLGGRKRKAQVPEDSPTNGQAGPRHSTIYMGRARVSLAGLSWPFTFVQISYADA